MIDVVYILGTGAAETDDWEIRISLRSWLKNFPELGKIWIVGHRPNWINLDHDQIRWLPADDPYKTNKDANLIQKMIRAAMQPELSDHFIFCSDDQGVLKESVFGDFKPYHCGPISEMRLAAEGEGHRKWQDRLVALGRWLDRHGYSSIHFDGHIPYPIEKERVADFLNCDFGAGGYPIMSLYFNLIGATGAPIGSDRIRAGLYSASEKPGIIDNKLAKNRFYSIGGGSPDCWYLVWKLEQMFPDPAPWEIGKVRNRYEEMMPEAQKELEQRKKEFADLELIEAAMTEGKENDEE